MVEDARYRSKVYFELYISRSNLVRDDGSTPAEYIFAYDLPDYNLVRVFKEKLNDVAFSIGEPESKALMDTDQTPYGYEENIPITIFTVDKTGVTGTTMKWTAETEMRRICDENPTGSQRRFERRGDKDRFLGSTKLYATEFILSYLRDTT